MREFYLRILNEGQDIAKALCGAQLWLRESTAVTLGLVHYYERLYAESGKLDSNAWKWMHYYRANPDVKPFTHSYYRAPLFISVV